jgi:exosortase B
LSNIRVAVPGVSALPWLLALAGIAVMYIPTYLHAAAGLWQADEFAHAPIVAFVSVWCAWDARHKIANAPVAPMMLTGSILLGMGLLSYVAGRMFTVSSVEFVSQVLVIAASVLLVKGVAALRAAWFPVLYLLFMVPLPGTFIDAVTSSLKAWVSDVVVASLYAAGYPVAQSGVIISVGQYQLLVADACSGLNSIVSLAAVGTLFIYLMARRDLVHNMVLIASILPIALLANVLRVMVLVLVTFHFGDEAGQGFLHDAAGFLVHLIALTFMVALDAAMSAMRYTPPRGSAPRADGR